MTFSSIKSVFIGGFGSIVLALFCASFVTIEKVLGVMPLFIGFNGCLIGYRLVEEVQGGFQKMKWLAFVMGIGGGAVAFSLVNLGGRLFENPFGLTLTDMFIYLILSGITSVLGARLAVRYFNL